MNKNSTQIIEAIPEQAKYTVLNSLVSSINCSIIGTANSMLAAFERRDPEFALEVCDTNEILELLREADFRNDALDNVRKLMRVRQELRDQLLAVANDDDIGSFWSSIEFMSQPSQTSNINPDKLREVFEMCGITDERALNVLVSSSINEDTRDRQRSAEQISKRQGNIEWMIEHVFDNTSYINEAGSVSDDVSDATEIEHLAPQQRQRLFDKLASALNRAMTRTASQFARGDSRVKMSDLIVLSALIKDAEALHVEVEDDVTV